MRTIRILTSDRGVQIPLWVRQYLDIGPNNAIKFTPVAGMLWMTPGEEYEIDITDARTDFAYITDEICDIVGFEPYDLLDIIELDGRLYLTPHVRTIQPCQVCDKETATNDFEGIMVCDDCLKKDLFVIIGGVCNG